MYFIPSLLIPLYTTVTKMSSAVSIKVRKEIIELAEKMVKYKLARSRSHTFNILIEKGLNEAKKDVEFWEQVYKDVEKLEKAGFKIAHGRLNKMLEEERAVDIH